ncbi:Potassium-transporting ATPase KdpC subunit, partial [Dissostichus eleginoides]
DTQGRDGGRTTHWESSAQSNRHGLTPHLKPEAYNAHDPRVDFMQVYFLSASGEMMHYAAHMNARSIRKNV